MQRRHLITATAAAALAASLGTSPANAQSTWPEGRNITMIVPFPPGGVADTVARPVAEALGMALLDQALHALDAAQLKALDLAAFEHEELARLGMPSGIVPRHRPPHFSHLFSGSSYAAAYYCYLYAEVLDADAFDAFTEAGSVFDRATADRVRRFIYSSGNSIEPGAAFRAFRGRDPVVEPMLRKKGLLV